MTLKVLGLVSGEHGDTATGRAPKARPPPVPSWEAWVMPVLWHTALAYAESAAEMQLLQLMQKDAAQAAALAVCCVKLLSCCATCS